MPRTDQPGHHTLDEFAPILVARVDATTLVLTFSGEAAGVDHDVDVTIAKASRTNYEARLDPSLIAPPGQEPGPDEVDEAFEGWVEQALPLALLSYDQGNPTDEWLDNPGSDRAMRFGNYYLQRETDRRMTPHPSGDFPNRAVVAGAYTGSQDGVSYASLSGIAASTDIPDAVVADFDAYVRRALAAPWPVTTEPQTSDAPPSRAEFVELEARVERLEDAQPE